MKLHRTLLALGCVVAACDADSGSETLADAAVAASTLNIDNTAWHYDATHDIYWQIGVQYCDRPVAEAYETLGLYVPGAYLRATANADGTYTASVNPDGKVTLTAQYATPRCSPLMK